MRTLVVWALVSGAWVAVAAAEPPVPPPPPLPPIPAPTPAPGRAIAPTPDPVPGPDHMPTAPGPDHAPPPGTPPPPVPGHAPDAPPPPPPPPPPAPPAPPPAPEVLSASSLGVVGKRHNVELQKDRLAVHLTVPANLVGECGNFVWVSVQFFDEAGAPIKSELPDHADADGNIKFTTQTAYVALPSERLNFGFLIPYGAFPKRQAGRYRVEARLRLVERRMPKNRPLATATTTFFVEG